LEEQTRRTERVSITIREHCRTSDFRLRLLSRHD